MVSGYYFNYKVTKMFINNKQKGEIVFNNPKTYP